MKKTELVQLIKEEVREMLKENASTDVGKMLAFQMRYPHDFIEEIWGESGMDKHLREKFSLVEGSEGEPALRIYKMGGNPKVGLDMEPPELVHSPNRLLTTS